MRIQHNILAMNAYRNYNTNVSALSKNLEKLSSGYKINRAGDDAAGLAISEKMRAQIQGLNAASKNVKDGTSLVKTAEGAMQEIQDMLGRMKYLATQSSNGTYDDEVDRAALQDEVDQLLSEINRIADSANFNGIKLLDGSMGMNSSAFEVVGTVTATDAAAVTNVIATDMPATGTTKNSNTILHKDGTTAQKGSFSIDVSQLNASVGGNTGKTASVTVTLAGTTITITAATAGADFTGADIANALKDATSGTGKYLIIDSNGAAKAGAAGDIKKGDLIYQATTSANGVVNFEATGYGSADSTFEAFADATLTSQLDKVHDGAVAASKHISSTVGVQAGNGDSTLTGAENLATTAPVDTTKPKAGTFGNTVLTIDPSKISEGMTITIAGETHTFNDSDIKLSDLDLNTADGQKDLTERIAKAFENNQHVSVGADSATVGKLTLAEKTDGAGAGAKSLASKEMQEAMSTLDGFKSLVSFKSAATGIGTELKITDGSVKEGDVLTINGKTYTFSDKNTGTANGTTYVAINGGAKANLTAALNAAGVSTGTSADGNLVINGKAGDTIPPSVLGKGLQLQIGDTSDSWNQLMVNVNDMHTSALGIADLSIETAEDASKSIQTIMNAINSVSSTRGLLGATQNRLDHTSNNLSVMIENIQDAESTIRDTDVAEEMMAYTKNNILVQSAQAMLAQANAVPQGVLQLLG